jgi:hypothetical protein
VIRVILAHQNLSIVKLLIKIINGTNMPYLASEGAVLRDEFFLSVAVSLDFGE